LIVDDEPDITLTLGKGLEQGGYKVDIFNDPLVALSNFRPDTYQLLILDIKMPYTTGFELYRKIKDIDSKSKVRVIMAFETYYEKFRQEFFPLEEIKGFIRKPVEIEDLIKFVDQVTKSNLVK
jgi:two-component system, OmpR family, response regulator ChvI